ncbi:MAG TPA: hypothetical protein VFX53_04560 [Pedococcus sp.]|nr:hypothetical protein [Pedococcus sp.]
MSDTPIYDAMARELVGFPAAWLAGCSAGDKVTWLTEIEVEVIAVGPHREWADLRCTNHKDLTWTGRQPLPATEAAEPAAEKPAKNGKAPTG